MTIILGQNGSGSRTIILGQLFFVNKEYHFGMEGVVKNCATKHASFPIIAQ